MHPDLWLRERIRLEHPGRETDGRFVLYWTSTALRVDDNPALLAARRMAHDRGLPLLVYQGLTARAPYASDRTHGFVLDGVDDLTRRYESRGMRHVFHLERGDGRDPPHALAALASQSAAVFTEDFPCGDLPRWRASLAKRTGRPVYAVDTACALPMQVVGRAWERAFAFRSATHEARMARIATAPRGDDGLTVSAWEGDLPFAPLRVRRDEVADVLATLRIDHTVGRVHERVGGEDRALAAWTAWRDAHLATYADRRTDAADATGASMMSAWLHFGMIAPWRLAADAVAQGGAGGEKYLDELLTWRELAWAFCAFRPDHGTLDAVPAWARRALDATRARRRTRPSRDAIERGRTGDTFFDLCQRSLVRHGELHNNARMTWGKILAGWYADPAEALAALTDLNHRWALDGRDPASYGGLLWCLGQFDRSQGEGAPGPLGAVSHRSGESHLRRVGASRWQGRVDRSRGGAVRSVAVVGVGVAGSLAARTLADHGLTVTALDKGRGRGGRASTRRREGLRYDLGVQRVTLTDPTLATLRDALVDARVLTAEKTTHRIAQGAGALAAALLDELPVRQQSTVRAITATPDGWIVDDGAAPVTADAVVLSAPVPQALALCDAGGVTFEATVRARLASVQYDPCLVVVVAPGRGSDLDAARALDDIAGVYEHEGFWVVHASAAWSRAHLEDALDPMGDALMATLGGTAGHGVQRVDAHRWRYAFVRPETALDGPVVIRGARGPLVLCGDAFGGAVADRSRGVEAALRAGAAAAGAVLSAR